MTTADDQLRAAVRKAGESASLAGIARQAGVTPQRLNEFLAGDRGKIPDLVHKVAAAVGMRVTLAPAEKSSKKS